MRAESRSRLKETRAVTVLVAVLAAFLASWILGSIDMALVGVAATPPENDVAFERLLRRVAVYAGSLGATWLVYKELKPKAKDLPVAAIVFVILASISVAFCAVTIGFTLFETFSFNKFPNGSSRRLWSKWTLIPVLRSALYLYWVSLSAIWLNLACVVYARLKDEPPEKTSDANRKVPG